MEEGEQKSKRVVPIQGESLSPRQTSTTRATVATAQTRSSKRSSVQTSNSDSCWSEEDDQTGEASNRQRRGAVTRGDVLREAQTKNAHDSFWRTTVLPVVAKCVEHRIMVILSVLFTMYALFSDDTRLLTTDLPADNWFSVMAIVCILFFSMELLMKCLAQSDYFLSFFFWLDMLATTSLLLDVTWISDALFQEESVKDGGDKARSGRTARVGASLGRVVRVIRLVRVLKLYKAYFERTQQQNKRSARSRIHPGGGNIEDILEGRFDGRPGSRDKKHGKVARAGTSTAVGNDGLEERLQKALDKSWESEEEHEIEEDELNSESAVGKKLVALTTRKVIILVLALLLILPFLTPQSEDVYASSAVWGADSVWESFSSMRGTEGGNLTRDVYERSVLKYIYYHNWFLGNGAQECFEGSTCASDFWAHTFWVGLAGSSLDTLRDEIEAASLREIAIETWERSIQSENRLFDLGSMPRTVQKRLSSRWNTHCLYGGLDHLGVSLLEEELEDIIDYAVRCPKDLRPQEIFRANAGLQTQGQFEDWHFVFFFDTRPLTKVQAVFGILTTLFICVVLTVASLLFSSDANHLVLQPVERMISKVKAIRDNPLLAIKMADSQLRADEIIKEVKERQDRTMKSISLKGHLSMGGRPAPLEIMKALWLKCFNKPESKDKQEEMMETIVLERTIVKLGSLLALGFGVAGVPIVTNNMKSLHNSSVNAMIPGNRVDCVIGIARIRNFTTATEVLKTKVMTFVNQIAEIVHGLAQEYNGGANRNNGDTFLIIWRLEDLDEIKRATLCDMSVTAFAKMLAEAHRSPVLAQYRSHPGLQQRLGSRCRVDLSFGLHLGWAVEGAVGSEFKIDASYLSPNVSITETIEHATRIYGVSLLASEKVVSACNGVTTSKCRLIDRVMIHGSREPLELYVLDLDPYCLEIRKERRGITWNVKQRFKARQLLEVHKQWKWSSWDMLEGGGKDIASMRRCFTVDFNQLFNMGFQNYSQGEWDVARRLLRHSSTMLGAGRRDGPSIALLQFMETYSFMAPSSWAGVRRLQDG